MLELKVDEQEKLLEVEEEELRVLKEEAEYEQKLGENLKFP